MKIPLLLSLAGLACLSLHAQTPAAAAPATDAKKAPHSLRLLCVEAAADASRLVVAEKTEEGWMARWRLTISSSYMTDALGLATRNIALAMDPQLISIAGVYRTSETPLPDTVLGKPAQIRLQSGEQGDRLIIDPLTL